MNNYTNPPTLGDIMRMHIAENGEAETRPMTDTYTTKLDMQNGTINICGGDTRVPILIDEWPALMESGQAEYERAKAIMENPLLDTRGIDQAMKLYRNPPSIGLSDKFIPMIEFYQNTLVMLRELERVLHEAGNSLSVLDFESRLRNEISCLRVWRDKIAAVLEAHKQHMPAIVEGE